MARSRKQEEEGDVRFHQLAPELWVLEARACARQWIVFHETYSFCLTLRLPAGTRVEWKYNRRLYGVDDEHITMAMQPGELHANTRQTPAADFIVVQVGESLMKRAARELGWGFEGLNIRHPHPGTGHPALTAALRRFERDLCTGLFESDTAQCNCWRSAGRHLENLSELVAAFIRHCAENAREAAPPAQGSAVVSRAVAYLRAHCTEPYELDRVAEAAGCGRFYLPRVFKREMGLAPSDYQNRVLVAKTCDTLALSPGAPLARIAQQVGWPGRGAPNAAGDVVTVMIRNFRKALGVTPGEFRAGLRGMSRADWQSYASTLHRNAIFRRRTSQEA